MEVWENLIWGDVEWYGKLVDCVDKEFSDMSIMFICILMFMDSQIELLLEKVVVGVLV